MKNTTKILFNTFAQYIRTVVNVILSLYATRLILEALGSNQYGIYTLVGGIVSMLSFFTNALTTTTQRYLSYNQNKGDINLLKSYFFNSLLIHACFGGVLLLLLAIVQPFLFSGFLNIDSQLVYAAKWVFFSIAIMLFTAMMTSPYRAILISRENIFYISIVDIIDGILKLMIGYALFVFHENRLIWYAILMMCVAFFNLLAIGTYSMVRFKESRGFKLSYISDKKIKELTGFAGWTIYGTLCLFGRVQGVAIVLNKFFSTVANAAYGIALQINSALNAISGALQTAIAPQLIKAEGGNNRKRMLMLSQTGCKVSFVLMSIVGFPIIFNINFVLDLWLGKAPEYCAFFCVVLVISNLIDQLTVGFNSSMNAVGSIKTYNLIINTIKLTTVLILALLLFYGVELHFAFLSYVVIELIGSILRIIICKKATGLNLNLYIKDVLIKLFIPTIYICGSYLLLKSIEINIWRIIVFSVLITSIYLLVVYKIGLSNDEKSIIKSIVKR